MNLLTYLYVALGGALGALARYSLSLWISGKTQTLFPWGTFFVNITGSFLLGFIYIQSLNTLIISPNLRFFLAVGFLGAYTTFSTFSLESLAMINNGQVKLAFFNLFGSVSAGLGAVWLGTTAAKYISR